MGGNALKHLAPVRLTSAEVIDLVHHLHRNWQLATGRSPSALPDHAPEVMGEIIHAMQVLLPPKVEREAALADPVRWSDMIRLARAAAVAAGRGMATREAPPIPAFVAAP